VHDAVIEAPPAPGVVTVKRFVSLVAQLLLPTIAAVGWEEQIVSGTDVIVTPMVSMTVGTISSVVPCVTVKEVLPEFFNSRLMDSTGHARNCIGTLFTPATVANSWVVPGVPAVTTAWFNGRLTSLLLTAATSTFRVCQVNCPTLEVISVPWLKARP